MKRRGFDGFNAAFDFDTSDRDMHRIANPTRSYQRLTGTDDRTSICVGHLLRGSN